MLTNDAPWTAEAKCRERDPEAFFPPPARGVSNKRLARLRLADVIATCRACPVRVECLQYALDHREGFGVWGGLTEKERRSLLKKTTEGAS